MVNSFFLVLRSIYYPDEVLTYGRAGFGHTLEKIGLLIVFGTILGSLLDHTNGTRSIAGFVLRRAGSRRTPLARVPIRNAALLQA